MVNQNPEPIVLSENIELQAGTSTDDIELFHQMAAPEVMNIYAIYCHIYTGYLDIGPNDDFPAPNNRRTWSDIQPVYIPVENNPARPDDSAEPDPLFVTLPLCCNPRTWTDLSLEIIVGNNPVPSKVINMGVVHSKLDKTLPFSTPVKVNWSQRLYIRLQNNNPAEPEFDTWSKIEYCSEW